METQEFATENMIWTELEKKIVWIWMKPGVKSKKEEIKYRKLPDDQLLCNDP